MAYQIRFNASSVVKVIRSDDPSEIGRIGGVVHEYGDGFVEIISDGETIIVGVDDVEKVDIEYSQTDREIDEIEKLFPNKNAA